MCRITLLFISALIWFSTQSDAQENLPKSPKSSLLIGTNLVMSNKTVGLRSFNDKWSAGWYQQLNVKHQWQLNEKWGLTAGMAFHVIRDNYDTGDLSEQQGYFGIKIADCNGNQTTIYYNRRELSSSDRFLGISTGFKRSLSTKSARFIPFLEFNMDVLLLTASRRNSIIHLDTGERLTYDNYIPASSAKAIFLMPTLNLGVQSQLKNQINIIYGLGAFGPHTPINNESYEFRWLGAHAFVNLQLPL
jgi:hypothetical protein